MDTGAFVRDGYVAVRGVFGQRTARACREMIWDVLRQRGISPEDRATWARPLVRIHCPEGEPFAAAGTSPRLHAACDELLGAGRWTRRAGVGGTVPVRFPSEDYPGEVGYHIEGSYSGAGDVYLCHPFIVHTATWPHRGAAPRMMAQPAIAVPGGFALDGSDPSPVARTIVEGLVPARG